MFEAFLFYNDNDEWDVSNVILIFAAFVYEACYLGAVGRKEREYRSPSCYFWYK